MGKIGIACKKCGRLFTGNKCPLCGWEISAENFKQIKRS